MVTPHNYSREEALQLGKKFSAEAFPDALCTFLGGSLLRGTGNNYSDVDIVFVCKKVDKCIHKSLVYEGLPIEYSLFDFETLDKKLERDHAKNKCSLLHLLSTSLLIANDLESKNLLLKKIKEQLAHPKSYSSEEITFLRYIVSDFLDDLRSAKDDPRIFGISMHIYPFIEELFFASHKAWRQGGKLLKETSEPLDREFYEELYSAYRVLMQDKEPNLLVNLLEALLEKDGGEIWAGYEFDILEKT